jgi:hypothetical protein
MTNPNSTFEISIRIKSLMLMLRATLSNKVVLIFLMLVCGKLSGLDPSAILQQAAALLGQ